MKSHTADIQTQDGLCDTYIVSPDGAKNLPVVLFYMDAIGVRKRLYDMANKMAEQGYYVMLPNLFYRTAKAPVVDYDHFLKPENVPNLFPAVRQHASQLDIEMAKRDIDAFLKFAESQQANARRVGAVGYCMGGGQALRAAGNRPDVIVAAASFHAGGLVNDMPSSPHLWFPKIKAEVFVGHADHDVHMPPEQQAQVKAELEKNHIKFTAELFKDCKHGWTMADLPAYNEGGEKEHWKKLFALFERTLKV